MEERTCESCGSVHLIKEFKLPARDTDSLPCQVCGAILEDWNSSTGWTLVETTKMTYRECDIQRTPVGTVIASTGKPLTLYSFNTTAKTSGMQASLKAPTLAELKQKIDEFFAA